MRLSKSSEYAIRCLVYIARSPEMVCSVKTLSTALGIPYKFLGRIMSQLAAAEIVTATRGKHGGYSFTRPLERLSLAEVIEAVEGLADYDRCILGFESCDDDNPCPLHDQWKTHKEGIFTMIHTVSLAELVEGEPGRI